MNISIDWTVYIKKYKIIVQEEVFSSTLFV